MSTLNFFRFLVLKEGYQNYLKVQLTIANTCPKTYFQLKVYHFLLFFRFRMRVITDINSSEL